MANVIFVTVMSTVMIIKRWNSCLLVLGKMLSIIGSLSKYAFISIYFQVYVMATHGLLSLDAPRILEHSAIDEVIFFLWSFSFQFLFVKIFCGLRIIKTLIVKTRAQSHKTSLKQQRRFDFPALKTVSIWIEIYGLVGSQWHNICLLK